MVGKFQLVGYFPITNGNLHPLIYVDTEGIHFVHESVPDASKIFNFTEIEIENDELVALNFSTPRFFGVNDYPFVYSTFENGLIKEDYSESKSAVANALILESETSSNALLKSIIRELGWSKLYNTIKSEEDKNYIIKNLSNLDFSVNSDNEVGFSDRLGKLKISNSDLSEILSELSIQLNSLEEYRTTLINNSDQLHQLELGPPLREVDFGDVEKFSSKVLNLLNLFGRQEERLAFALISVLHFPFLAKTIVRHKDRAQSGRMGIRILESLYSYDEADTQNDVETKLLRVVNQTLYRWKTGDRDLYILFIQKWTKHFPNFRSYIIERYPFYYLPRYKASLEKSDQFFVSIDKLFQANILDAKNMVETYERNFDHAFHYPTVKY